MRRPFCVTILLWLTFSLAAWSGIRLLTVFIWWPLAIRLTSQSLLVYVLASGLIWFLVSLLLLWKFMSGTRHGILLIISSGTAFLLWYWIDRWLFASPSPNWGFALGMTLLLLICVILCTLHPETRKFLSQREPHVKQREDPKA